MVFAHSSTGAPLSGDATVISTDAQQSANDDCLAHRPAGAGDHVDDADTPPHKHGIADACCNAVCSIAAKFSVFQLGSDTAARIYDLAAMAPPKVTLLGLPTPPPDSII